MCPEEVGIEDASKIKIDQLIEMKELEFRDVEDKSAAIDNVSVVSFGDQSWSSTNSEWQRKEEKENGNSQVLEDKIQSISKHVKNIQLNAINAEVQGS